MTKTKFVPLSLSALLLASPLAMAVEAHHPETAAATDSGSAPAATPAEGGAETSGAAGGGPTTGGPEATGAGTIAGQEDQGSDDVEDAAQGGSMGPGMMMMGGPGMIGCRRMMTGMMGGPGMMGRQGMMSGPGMMAGRGMMGQGMGRCAGMCGGQYSYAALIDRLDLLDARMAKIETMLEWMLQQ
jgi:hypothetical protein